MSLRDFAVLLAVCLIWAGNSVFSKIVISGYAIPPLFYTSARFLVVIVATAPWLLPAPRPLWRILVVGLLMGAANFGFNFIGLRLTSPSASAVVGQLGAPIATILSVLMLGETIGWRRGLGIVLAFAGGLIVMWNGSRLSLAPGLLWVLGSAVAAALGAVMMKQIAGVKPLQFQAWVGFSSIWPLAALSALTERGQLASVAHAPLVFAGAVLFSGLLVSVVAHTAYYGLVQRHPGTLLQPLTLISTLATIGLGVLVTHDHVGPRMAIGSSVALAGVLIIALRRNHVMPLLLLLRNRAL